MKKKGFFGELFDDLGKVNPDDHDLFVRIGEGLLEAITTQVDQTQGTLTALNEEIAEYKAEWDRECKESDDWPLGKIIAVSYLRRMTQLNAQIKLAYRITDSWRDKEYGILS